MSYNDPERDRKWEESKRTHPNVDHVKVQWVDELTMSRAGVKYKRPVKIYVKG